MIREAQEQDQKNWDEFVEKNPQSHFSHLYHWRTILEKSFNLKTYYLLSENNNGIDGILPLAFQKSLLFGRNLISLPFLNQTGSLISDGSYKKDLIESALNKAKELNAQFMELRFSQSQQLDLNSRTHKVTFILKIPESSQILWKELKDKVRNQVRKAEKSNLEFRTFGKEGIDDFYSVFSLNMRNLGSPVLSNKLFMNIFEYFPNEAKIHTVFDKGKPIATGLTIQHQNKMEIPWAASNWKYLKMNPNIFLYWNILCFACDQKVTQFDFGRCNPESGTYHFKKQWGGDELPLYWYYWCENEKYIPNLTSKPGFLFNLASSLWKSFPLSLANRFGPYISKFLPI